MRINDFFKYTVQHISKEEPLGCMSSKVSV